MIREDVSRKGRRGKEEEEGGELGDSQAREERVDSTLCKHHTVYRSVVQPPHPAQRGLRYCKE